MNFFTHIYVCTYICIYTYIFMYVYIYIYVYICIHMYIVHIYAYIGISLLMIFFLPVINHGSSQKMSFVMPSNYWKTQSGASPPTPMADSGVNLESSGGGMIASSNQVSLLRSVCCSVLQCVPSRAHCNTLQHTATHSNTL